jgi:hypothetical protein
MSKWEYLLITKSFNLWQGMEFSDCLQLTIALLSGRFELVRVRSGLNNAVKQ